MPTATETQAYLDEAKNPSVIGLAELRNGVKAAVPLMARAAEQATLLARLMAEAEIVEPNPEVEGKFEESMQRLRAVKRIHGEIERQMRDYVQAWKAWKALDTELRALASQAGYTV